jgi:hypothetical protein
MTSPRRQPPQGKAALPATDLASAVPVTETPRLRLRAQVLGDFPACAGVLTRERAHCMGGPFTGEQAFADFCQGIAGWMLRGAGMWTVPAVRPVWADETEMNRPARRCEFSGENSPDLNFRQKIRQAGLRA